jgi:hypothetical protein
MSYETAPATALVATSCACCGRPLLDVESLRLGVGPTCAKRNEIAKVVLFPDWSRTLDALGREEYDALEIDKRRAIYKDFEVARFVANRLVYRIAADPTGPRAQARTLGLAALGYDKLAASIADRLGAVRVEEEGELLVVKAPKSEAFIAEMRRVPGSRWVGERRARLVPVASKRSLWGAIRAAFPGALVIGTKRLAVA